jgi:histidine triad (HIT) family protein
MSLQKHNIDTTITPHNCVFCKIANGQIPAEILYSDDNFFVIKDIKPQAPLHYLAIPRAHFATMLDADINQAATVGIMLKTIAAIKGELGLHDYRLINNQGKEAGQTMFHYHIHILGGKELSDF